MTPASKADRHIRSAERSARLMVIHQAMAGRELINARKAMGETRGPKAPDDEHQAWAKLCKKLRLTTRVARELMSIAEDKRGIVDRLGATTVHHPPEVEGKQSRLGSTKTIRKLLESLDLIPLRKPPTRPVRNPSEADLRRRDPLALPREVARRKGYVPVAGPYADAEADQLASAIRQLTSGGARVALVGSEIWRRKK